MKEIQLKEFDIKEALADLLRVGVTSIDILPEELREKLLEETSLYLYNPLEEYVGPHSVRQQISIFKDIPPESRFLKLRDYFTWFISSKLSKLDIHPFATKLKFNEPELQKYDVGSIGIGPHMDHKSYINLIAIFNIGGQGRFFTCDDRLGTNAREIDVTPGRLTLMRAPGFDRSDIRPFHFVTDIKGTRHVFTLRQKDL